MIIFDSVDGSTLMKASKLKEMCAVEINAIRSLESFMSSCIKLPMGVHCCHSWSIGNYVALLNNRSSCFEITDEDVEQTVHLLQTCLPFEQSGFASKIPSGCAQYDHATHYLLHYLTDRKFLEDVGGRVNTHLSYAITVLPLVSIHTASLPVYDELDWNLLSAHEVRVAALKFDIKEEIFSRHIFADMVFAGVGAVLLFLLVLVYVKSLFITLMTFIAVGNSLIIAYLLYTYLFGIRFFPFINLLTVIILLGTGCDDVFVLCRAWMTSKQRGGDSMTIKTVVYETLSHAALSMFVTSLTTAGAFFANCVSSILVLRCFVIFAGTAILCNYFMMVTWMASVLVMHERWCMCCSCRLFENTVCFKKFNAFLQHLSVFLCVLCEEWLPKLVFKLRYVWLFIFPVLAVCGAIIVFVWPKLHLPSTDKFPYFSVDHHLETYDLKLKDQFRFSKSAWQNNINLPLTFVWGVKAIDNSDHLDPDSKGSLVLDPDFNMSLPSSQEWLLSFCQTLRRASFFRNERSIQFTNCYIEQFKRFMETPCIYKNISHSLNNPIGSFPCCRDSKFPFSTDVFEWCLKVWLYKLPSSSSQISSVNFKSGPRFLIENSSIPKLVASVVEFSAKETFSVSYERMKIFYDEVESFTSKQLFNASSGMRNGWFVSYLEFFDLQHSLASETSLSILISMGIATVVALFTTCNWLITIYAMTSIGGAIFVTVGLLVLLGWELNIVESVIISLAIGLSIDFVLHYGVSYNLSSLNLPRKQRFFSAFTFTVSPVGMAALTTFIAGAIMMPSTVQAYRQIGIFLMLVMLSSWLFATLFFGALLVCFGPQGHCGSFMCLKICKHKADTNVDENVELQNK